MSILNVIVLDIKFGHFYFFKLVIILIDVKRRMFEIGQRVKIFV